MHFLRGSKSKKGFLLQGELLDEYDDLEPFLDLRPTRPSSGPDFDQTLASPHSKLQQQPPENRFFSPGQLPEILRLPSTVPRSASSLP